MRSRYIPLIATVVVFAGLYLIGLQRFPGFGRWPVPLSAPWRAPLPVTMPETSPEGPLSALWAAQATKTPFVATYHGVYGAKNSVKRWYNAVMTRGAGSSQEPSSLALPSTTDTRTLAMPDLIMPSSSAAARVTSMTRPPVNGPRSLIRTMTSRPFARFSTRTLVPKGRLGWAAARAEPSERSPLAV